MNHITEALPAMTRMLQARGRHIEPAVEPEFVRFRGSLLDDRLFIGVGDGFAKEEPALTCAMIDVYAPSPFNASIDSRILMPSYEQMDHLMRNSGIVAFGSPAQHDEHVGVPGFYWRVGFEKGSHSSPLAAAVLAEVINYFFDYSKLQLDMSTHTASMQSPPVHRSVSHSLAHK